MDITPADMEELAEVVTVAVFHPRRCGVLGYSSRGGLAGCATAVPSVSAQQA